MRSCKVFASFFVIAINFSSIAMDKTAIMGQYSSRVQEIQDFFYPYLGKIKTDTNLYRRVQGLQCDGIFNAQTFELIIAALQFEIKEPVDGWFGKGTEQKCPIIRSGSPQPLVRIVQAGLCFNGIDVSFDGVYTEEATSVVRSFQHFMCLPATGEVDGITMKVLFSSGGSKERPATGCDCATQLTIDSCRALYREGYRYVGRYLTSKIGRLQKHLTQAEIFNILSVGLRLIVFFQEGLHDQNHCTTQGQGNIDGEKAIKAANELNLPKGSTIYGVIDADVENPELLMQYFLDMSVLIRKAGFEFGVYGSRAVCSLMHNKAVSTYSYVCGMSYRYKGNLGYPMPLNWAFNQEYELKNVEKFEFSGGSFDLDRVVVSGRDKGIGPEDWAEP